MEPLRYLVQANLILTVLVLAYALVLRRTTRFDLNRAVLWVIAFEAVCLPFAKLPTVQPEPVRAVVHQTTEVFRKPFRLGWRIVRLRILIENGMWTRYTDFVLVQAPVKAPFPFGRFVVLKVATNWIRFCGTNGCM